MPRPTVLPTVPFAWYYVARSAAHGRKLVTSREELTRFQQLLSITLTKTGAQLHFAHVDEHEMHLAVRAGEGSLTGAVGLFCHEYARQINRARHEKGSLFRPHGHLLRVQPETWIVSLGRFIHWLPRLRHSATFWNTGALYRDRKRMFGLTTSVTFRAVSHGSRKPHVQDLAYGTFFDQPPTPSEIEHFRSGSPEDPRILGDSKFIARVHRELGLPASRRPKRHLDTQEDIQRTTAMLIEGFQRIWEENLPPAKAREWKNRMTLEHVCSKSRKQPLPMVRALSAAYLMAHQSARLANVERFFHCRPGTLSEKRRRHYQGRFQQLFNVPYEQLLERKLHDIVPTQVERSAKQSGGKDCRPRSLILETPLDERSWTATPSGNRSGVPLRCSAQTVFSKAA
jgi:hypothetical protein